MRGFRECGLEPGDRNDSVGGDVYMAGGANIYYFPIPKVGPIYSFLVLIFALVDSLCFFPYIGFNFPGLLINSLACLVWVLPNI